MKYQLTIQLPSALYGDLYWLATLEDRLDTILVDSIVDGHDIANDIINIFIHTDEPVMTFSLVKNLLEADRVDLTKIRSNYRELTGEHYTHLWPLELCK